MVVLVAEAAAAGLHGDATSVTEGLLLAATILFWSVALDAIAYRCPGVGRVIKAQPRPLISVIRRDPEETDEPVRPEAAL